MDLSRAPSALFLFLAMGGAHAQQSPPPFEIRPFDQLVTDTASDGTIWALGASWKMKIGTDGAVFYPKLGERAVRHMPLAFGVPQVSIGGVGLPMSAAQASLDGMRAVLDRGDVDEIYDFAPNFVEQSFRIERLPTRGELRVRVPITTELEYRGRNHGLELEAPGFGHVRYGDATIFDAANRRCEAISELRDGAIEIVVPEAFVRAAALPLVVDPLIQPGFNVVTSGVIQDVDVAYDLTNDVWLVVYQEGSTAGDRDILARRFTGSGAFIDSVSVNITDDDTTDPAVANVSSADRFLAVWRKAKGGLFDEIEIQGRTRNASNLAQSGIFEISKGRDNEANPTVGGGTSKFMVAWQEDPALGFGGDNIAIATVSTTGTVGQVIPVATNSADEQKPAISDAIGNTFVVAWERVVGNQRDIHAAALDSSGGIDVADTAIFDFLNREHDPVVTNDQSGTFLISCEIDNNNGDDFDTDARISSRRVLVLLGETNFEFLSDPHPITPLSGEITLDSHVFRHHVALDGSRYVFVHSLDNPNKNRLRTAGIGTTQAESLEVDVPIFAGFEVSKLRCSSRSESLQGEAGRVLILAIARPSGSSAAKIIRGEFASSVTPGGVTVIETGCGGALEPQLSTFDDPFLCDGFQLTVTGFPLGGVLFVGVPGSTPLCGSASGCTLGVLPSLTLPISNGLIETDLPCITSLLGAQIGMTGAAFLPQPVPGVCGPPKFAQTLATSDTLILDFK